MAIALVIDTELGGTTNDGVTSAAVDTTGATLLVVVSSYYDAVTTPTLTDSKSNTWTHRTVYTNAIAARISYCAAPTVGSGHTFTLTGTDSYSTINVLAFSGTAAAPYDTENGASATSGTSLATGSLTPSEANCVVVTGGCFDRNGGFGSGFTCDSGTTVSGAVTETSVHEGGAAAYKIQTTAAAMNPTWSWTYDSYVSVVSAAFKSAAVGGVVPVFMHQYRQRRS